MKLFNDLSFLKLSHKNVSCIRREINSPAYNNSGSFTLLPKTSNRMLFTLEKYILLTNMTSNKS